TLKGNTAIFGFQSLSERMHEAESTLVENPDVDVPTLVVELQRAWQANLDRVAEHLDKGEPGVWLTAAEHASHVKALAEETPYRQLYATALRWRLEPTVRRLKQLAFSARSTAGSIGKELQVDVDGNWVRLPSRRFAPLWSGLVHVVRNAVDHGIETPEQRVQRGKSRQGRIDFATRFENAELVVEIRDDGAGIDWDRLRQRAREKGVADVDAGAPHRLLFVDGLSTMDEVTQLSGRGVGMGALLRVVEELQGRIVVDTERGVGTTFQFRFPLHSIPELGEQRSAA
ncbi:MAG: ATP-binding protein, partial [Myxococcota bacterium]